MIDGGAVADGVARRRDSRGSLVTIRTTRSDSGVGRMTHGAEWGSVQVGIGWLLIRWMSRNICRDCSGVSKAGLFRTDIDSDAGNNGWNIGTGSGRLKFIIMQDSLAMTEDVCLRWHSNIGGAQYRWRGIYLLISFMDTYLPSVVALPSLYESPSPSQ